MMAHQQQFNQFSSDSIPWGQSFEHNSHEFFGSVGGFVQRDSLDASTKNSTFAALTDHHQQATMMRPWDVDDSSLRSLIQSEGSSSTDQSKERLASSLFNIKQTQTPTQSYGVLQYQQQLLLMQDARTTTTTFRSLHQPFQLRNSKYLSAAHEVLNEFCSLQESSNTKNIRINKAKLEELGEHQPYSSSSSLKMQSMDLLELQKIKTTLLSMLEEVDKRYKRYCDQIRMVVVSFEAVAGEGSATVYTALALKAMSRHFRCLKDGIMVQIRTMRKLMGEKEDTIAPGTTKGETPRLKLLDRCIRQQKAFQQGMMEQHPWRPQRGLPERSVSILRSWLFEHFLHPYPNDVDKHILARETGLSRSQVSNWFINARVRLWKPMVEEMYMEETKDVDDQSQHEMHAHEGMLINNPNSNPSPGSSSHDIGADDQKPLAVQQLSDSDHHSLSSIINSSHDGSATRTKVSLHQQHSYGGSNYDFLYGNNNVSCSNAGTVSLTLGLQRHGEGRAGNINMVSFSSNTNQSLLFANDDADDGQVRFSIMDGESDNLPYRNLMGRQLLHDLA